MQVSLALEMTQTSRSKTLDKSPLD
jgi:hypothetical protein